MKAIWDGMASSASWVFDYNGWVIEKEWRGDVDVGWAKIEKFFNMGRKKWTRDYSGPHHTNCILDDDGNICVKHNEKCDQCDKIFKSEKIHVGKSHKKVSSMK